MRVKNRRPFWEFSRKFSDIQILHVLLQLFVHMLDAQGMLERRNEVTFLEAIA